MYLDGQARCFRKTVNGGKFISFCIGEVKAFVFR